MFSGPPSTTSNRTVASETLHHLPHSHGRSSLPLLRVQEGDVKVRGSFPMTVSRRAKHDLAAGLAEERERFLAALRKPESAIAWAHQHDWSEAEQNVVEEIQTLKAMATDYAEAVNA